MQDIRIIQRLFDFCLFIIIACCILIFRSYSPKGCLSCFILSFLVVFIIFVVSVVSYVSLLYRGCYIFLLLMSVL